MAHMYNTLYHPQPSTLNRVDGVRSFVLVPIAALNDTNFGV